MCAHGLALPEEEEARSETSSGNTPIYSLVGLWLLMHDFGLNERWLWDFQLGPALGCWGSIINQAEMEGTIHQHAA